jgi:hypothetical protein
MMHLEVMEGFARLIGRVRGNVMGVIYRPRAIA